MKLVEPIAVVDIFTSGLGSVEILKGGMARLIFYVEQTGEDGSFENVVAAKIVLPMDAVERLMARVH